MMSPSVHLLLERVIDTPLKLHCVILFAQRSIMRGTASQIAARLSRDIWSTKQALEELAEAGMLLPLPGDREAVYEYQPRQYFEEVLALLVEVYNDPLRRAELHDCVRELARYAPYRADFSQFVRV